MAATRRGKPLGPGRIDLEKVEATTEEDTLRYLAEDGFDPDNPLKGFRQVVQVAALRKRTGLSQDAFAKALRIPVATVRNWEQGRTPPDPAARSLLALVDADPDHTLAILSGSRGAAAARRTVKVVLSEPTPDTRTAHVFDTQQEAVDHVRQIAHSHFSIIDAEYVRDPEWAFKAPVDA